MIRNRLIKSWILWSIAFIIKLIISTFFQQDAERPGRHSHAERGNEKQVNSIYSTGALAFKRVKGEPGSSMPKNCRLLERQSSIVFDSI